MPKFKLTTEVITPKSVMTFHDAVADFVLGNRDNYPSYEEFGLTKGTRWTNLSRQDQFFSRVAERNRRKKSNV